MGGHAPPMLYDYYGFPPEAYRIKYAAPGDPGLAEHTASVLRCCCWELTGTLFILGVKQLTDRLINCAGERDSSQGLTQLAALTMAPLCH